MNFNNSEIQDYIEINRENYWFVTNVTWVEPKAYVFKQTKDGMRALYTVDLVAFTNIEQRLEYVSEQFFKHKDKLVHEGYSKQDIKNLFKLRKGIAS